MGWPVLPAGRSGAPLNKWSLWSALAPWPLAPAASQMPGSGNPHHCAGPSAVCPTQPPTAPGTPGSRPHPRIGCDPAGAPGQEPLGRPLGCRGRSGRLCPCSGGWRPSFRGRGLCDFSASVTEQRRGGGTQLPAQRAGPCPQNAPCQMPEALGEHAVPFMSQGLQQAPRPAAASSGQRGPPPRPGRAGALVRPHQGPGRAANCRLTASEDAGGLEVQLAGWEACAFLPSLWARCCVRPSGSAPGTGQGPSEPAHHSQAATGDAMRRPWKSRSPRSFGDPFPRVSSKAHPAQDPAGQFCRLPTRRAALRGSMRASARGQTPRAPRRGPNPQSPLLKTGETVASNVTVLIS